jgi:hypothetical protein
MTRHDRFVSCGMRACNHLQSWRRCPPLRLQYIYIILSIHMSQAACHKVVISKKRLGVERGPDRLCIHAVENKRLVTFACDCTPSGERGQKPSCLQPPRWRHGTHHRAVAAPRPFSALCEIALRFASVEKRQHGTRLGVLNCAQRTRPQGLTFFPWKVVMQDLVSSCDERD